MSVRFCQADVHDIAPGLLAAILSKIESAGSAEKVAENDHLMRCARASLFISRDVVTYDE